MDTYKLSFKVPKGKLGGGKFYTLKELTSNPEHKSKILDHIKKYYIVTYNNLEDPSTDLLSSDVIIHVQKNDTLKSDLVYYSSSYSGYFGMSYLNPATGKYDTLSYCFGFFYQNNQPYKFPSTSIMTRLEDSLEKINFDCFQDTLFRHQDPLLVEVSNKSKLKHPINVKNGIEHFFKINAIKSLQSNGLQTVYDVVFRYLEDKNFENMITPTPHRATDIWNIEYILINDSILFKKYYMETFVLRGNADYSLTSIFPFTYNLYDSWVGKLFKVMNSADGVVLETKESIKAELDTNGVNKHILNLKLEFCPYGKYVDDYDQEYIVDETKFKNICTEFLSDFISEGAHPVFLTDAYITKHKLNV